MFVQPTNEREEREKEWRLKLGWARLKYTNWRRSFMRAIGMQSELSVVCMAKVGVGRKKEKKSDKETEVGQRA